MLTRDTTATAAERTIFAAMELPKVVPVETAIKYFYWLGLELAGNVMLYYGDDLTIGAELKDIRDTLQALDKEQGKVRLTNNDMAPCGVVYERK